MPALQSTPFQPAISMAFASGTWSRILLPPPLREFARLVKNVVLIGQGNKFEIWDEAMAMSDFKLLERPHKQKAIVFSVSPCWIKPEGKLWPPPPERPR